MAKMLLLLVCIILGAEKAYSCCFPKQSEGKEMFSFGQIYNGQGMAISGLVDFAYDYDKRRVYTAGTVKLNGKEANIAVLRDYNSGNKYEVIDGVCKVKPADFPMLPCVPDDATKTSSHYGVGSKKFAVDIYNYVHEGYEYTMTVMPDSCTIVAETIITDNKMLNLVLLDQKPEITDPAKLDIPTDCPQP